MYILHLVTELAIEKTKLYKLENVQITEHIYNIPGMTLSVPNGKMTLFSVTQFLLCLWSFSLPDRPEGGFDIATSQGGVYVCVLMHAQSIP